MIELFPPLKLPYLAPLQTMAPCVMLELVAMCISPPAGRERKERAGRQHSRQQMMCLHYTRYQAPAYTTTYVDQGYRFATQYICIHI